MKSLVDFVRNNFKMPVVWWPWMAGLPLINLSSIFFLPRTEAWVVLGTGLLAATIMNGFARQIGVRPAFRCRSFCLDSHADLAGVQTGSHSPRHTFSRLDCRLDGYGHSISSDRCCGPRPLPARRPSFPVLENGAGPAFGTRQSPSGLWLSLAAWNGLF
jgi:hypothetical protein